MDTGLNSLITPPFLLNVTLRPEHFKRAQEMPGSELRTGQNSPVTLAIRDKLRERDISHAKVCAVHCALGSYTELWGPSNIKDERPLFKAEHPKELVEAYEFGFPADAMKFQLEFHALDNDTAYRSQMQMSGSVIHRIYNWIKLRLFFHLFAACLIASYSNS